MLCFIDWQGLRIDFDLISASESNDQYQQFLKANHRDHIRHLHATVEGQLHPKGPCVLCADAGVACEEFSGKGAPQVVDVMVTGSPCDPFSVQRAKRFQTGAVKDHVAYKVTMSSVVSMYLKYQPHVGVLEQVMGFTYPLDVTTDETPYQRPGRDVYCLIRVVRCSHSH